MIFIPPSYLPPFPLLSRLLSSTDSNSSVLCHHRHSDDGSVSLLCHQKPGSARQERVAACAGQIAGQLMFTLSVCPFPGLGNCVRCRGGGTTVLVLLPGLLFTLFWSVSPRLAWEAGHAHSTHLPGRTLLAHTHSSAPLLDFKVYKSGSLVLLD